MLEINAQSKLVNINLATMKKALSIYLIAFVEIIGNWLSSQFQNLPVCIRC